MLYFDLDWIRGNIKDSEYALRERRYEAYLAGDKSHIKGKKVRLAKNSEQIAIWAIFVSI